MRRQSSTNSHRPPPSHPSQPSPIHPSIWRSCAGSCVQTPTVNSTVYYFIQGHLDQASSTPEYLSPHVYYNPFVLARIVHVQFLADPNTDEVFTKLVLHPINDSSVSPPPVAAGKSSNSSRDEEIDVAFTKILTPSDAKNDLSVPSFGAQSIFPPLPRNFQFLTQFQPLSITDVHRNVWEVRHVYCGMPQLHYLTNGWSNFVNSKNLVAGDSLLFMKNSRGEIIVGVRRSKRPRGYGSGESGTDLSAIMHGIGGVRIMDEEEEEGFSSNGNGNLAPEKVVEAANLAVEGKPFEVVYYPSAGWSDFVVKAEIVDEAMKVKWSPGMRVKMAVATENSSMMSWIQGTVSAVFVRPENRHWCGSPWKMLQVAWDEPEGLQNPKLVSPWQVELESATPPLRTAFTPTKWFRAAHGSLVSTDGEGDSNSTMGHLNGTISVGMQGVNQNRKCKLYQDISETHKNDPEISQLCCQIQQVFNDPLNSITPRPLNARVHQLKVVSHMDKLHTRLQQCLENIYNK